MVASLEVRLEDVPAAAPRLVRLPSVIEDYLRQFKETMNKDQERTRALLAKLIGPVTLRRNGTGDRPGSSKAVWVDARGTD